jgi:Tfp pilus assembly protein PilN
MKTYISRTRANSWPLVSVLSRLCETSGKTRLLMSSILGTVLDEYLSLVLTPELLVRSQEEALRIDALAEEIATIQNLRNSFNPILSVILMALDSPAIFVRTKALKALGVIVTSDSTILSAVRINFEILPK